MPATDEVPAVLAAVEPNKDPDVEAGVSFFSPSFEPEALSPAGFVPNSPPVEVDAVLLAPPNKLGVVVEDPPAGVVFGASSSFLAPNPVKFPKAEEPVGAVVDEGVVVDAGGAGGLKDPKSPPVGAEVADVAAEVSAGFGAPKREGKAGADDVPEAPFEV